MAEDWLIENITPGAKLCIIMGPATTKMIEKELQNYQTGILWLLSPNDPPPNIQHPNLLVYQISDPEGEEFNKLLDQFVAQDYSNLPSIKAYKTHDPLWIKVMDTLVIHFDSTKRARKTRAEDGLIRQQNIFQNLPHYIQKQVPTAWKNYCQDKLAVVVGAGPSLDITLPIIKSWTVPFTLISTDSAIHAVRQVGLQPDIVLSIDPAKTLQSCIQGEYKEGILVANSTTHPSWLKNWDCDLAMISGYVLCEDYLANQGLAKSELIAINNVGLTAISLANFLGPEAIILLGMDLASDAKSGFSRYAEITSRPQGMITFGAKIYKIPGNFEPYVQTSFLSDWKDTSNFCKEVAQQRYLINITDRGAQIEGAVLIHPNKATELEETLREVITEKVNSAELLDKRVTVPDELLQLLFEKLATACDRAWKPINQIIQSPSPTLEQKFHCLGQLMTDPDFPSIIGDYSFAIMPVLLSENRPEETILNELIENVKVLIWKLEDALIQLPVSKESLSRFLTSSFA
jgi:hypothetical protein